MASHEVFVTTTDRSSSVLFNPSSVNAQPGDIITFTSKHRGAPRPGSVMIQFTSGNVCDASDGGRSVSQLQLELAGSARVQMCPNAGAGAISFQAGIRPGGDSIQSSPEMVFDDE